MGYINKKIGRNMLKNIKDFLLYEEEYLYEEEIVDSIYLDLISEGESILESYGDIEEDWDWSKYSPGEERKYKEGKQVLKRYQALGAYLRALGEAQGNPDKYILSIPGIIPFSSTKASGSGKITLHGLADALDINAVPTLQVYVELFRRLIKKEEIDDNKGIHFPKIREAFVEFKKESPRDLIMSMSGLLADPGKSTKHREAESETLISSKTKRDEMKRTQRSIGYNVSSLVTALRKNPLFKEKGKAEKSAVDKIAREYGMDPEDVSRSYYDFINSKR